MIPAHEVASVGGGSLQDAVGISLLYLVPYLFGLLVALGALSGCGRADRVLGSCVALLLAATVAMVSAVIAHPPTLGADRSRR